MSCTPSAQGASSKTAVCTNSSSGHSPALSWSKSPAPRTTKPCTGRAPAEAAGLARFTPRARSLRGKPGCFRTRSLAAEPMAVRARPLSRLSWIAATVLETRLANSRCWRWLASSAAGSSLLLAAALAALSASSLPACHPAGHPLLTSCCGLRWLGIHLQCTSSLSSRASARLCQQLPASAFLVAPFLRARMATHMCSTALQSVITVPPGEHAATAQAAAAASPAQTDAPMGK